MTITYVGNTFASGGSDTDTGGQAVSVAPPAGTAVGDLLIFYLYARSGDTFNNLRPAGWNYYARPSLNSFLWRFADGTANDTFTGTTSYGLWWIASVSAWRGVNTDNPFRDQYNNGSNEFVNGGGHKTLPSAPYLVTDNSQPTLLVWGSAQFSGTLTSAGTTVLTSRASLTQGSTATFSGGTLTVWSAVLSATATLGADQNVQLNCTSSSTNIGLTDLLLFPAAKPSSSWAWCITADNSFYRGVPSISSNKAVISANSTNSLCPVFAKKAALRSDYSVQMDCTVDDASSWSFQEFRIFGRAQNPFDKSAFLQSYAAYLHSAGGSWTLDLLVHSGGGQTTIGTYAPTITGATTVSLTLEMVGSSITVKLNGSSVISVTDSTYSGPGYLGVGINVPSGATQSIDNVIGKYL